MTDMDNLHITGGSNSPSTYDGNDVIGGENVGFGNFVDALIEVTEGLESFMIYARPSYLNYGRIY